MNKQDVIDFFNKSAPKWNDNLMTDDKKMNRILDVAGVGAGKKILDVACGTGVMTRWYIKRDVESVYGIDISSRMIDVARSTYDEYSNVRFDCMDAEAARFEEKFDCAVVFNAFPHFINPDVLIANLYDALLSGGTLTVAHDRGRKAIDRCHSGEAGKISNGLMSEDDLAKLFENAGLGSITKIATEEIYIVSGIK